MTVLCSAQQLTHCAAPHAAAAAVTAGVCAGRTRRMRGVTDGLTGCCVSLNSLLMCVRARHCAHHLRVCVCVCVNSTFPSSTVQSTRAHARRTHVTDKTPVGGSTWPGPVSIATGRTAISVGKKDRRKQEKVKRKKI